MSPEKPDVMVQNINIELLTLGTLVSSIGTSIDALDVSAFGLEELLQLRRATEALAKLDCELVGQPVGEWMNRVSDLRRAAGG